MSTECETIFGIIGANFNSCLTENSVGFADTSYIEAHDNLKN
jgi:hypothetical protein